MANNFGNADHREVFRIDDNVAPSSPHSIPASTKKFNVRPRSDSRSRLSSGAELHSQASPQSFDELSPIHFTRGLTSRDENPHPSIVTVHVGT